jgi:hypothetical protein
MVRVIDIVMIIKILCKKGCNLVPNELVYAKHGDTNMQIYDNGGSIMERKKG